MSVSPRVLKVLWARAGGVCSFPGCGLELAFDANVLLGENAHIVAQSREGPRGEYEPPGGDIDGYENLILLCDVHHKVVDAQPATYTVAKLVQMRRDHETIMAQSRTRDARYAYAHPSRPNVTEKVHSTLLPVALLPARVYSAPCAATEDEVKSKFSHPTGSSLMFPFIVRAERLFTFSSARDRSSPFRPFIRPNGDGSESAQEWWDDPDRFRWYVQLLNRTLNKLTGRRGLNLDKAHKRYYFEQAQDGEPSSVTYRSLTGKRTSRQVVWRPAFRHSGELKNYWEHLAVGLRFHRVTATGWCISVRPERRFTRDGRTLLTPKGTGRRATSRKSHMYNINVLAEVNFWREFLADRGPRIIMKFGAQSLIVDAEMMSVTVSWPGVPDDARPVTYTRAEDDLFTTAEYHDLMRSGLEDDDGEEEEEEESGAD